MNWHITLTWLDKQGHIANTFRITLKAASPGGAIRAGIYAAVLDGHDISTIKYYQVRRP